MALYYKATVLIKTTFESKKEIASGCDLDFELKNIINQKENCAISLDGIYEETTEGEFNKAKNQIGI